jgi:hypothetical protein
LLVALSACSDPFEAAPSLADAQPTPNESDATDAPPSMEAGLLDATDAGLSPPVAGDLLLWLRADMGVTQTHGLVSTWADQSGHHMDAVQTDPMKQPKLGSRGSGTRPAVVFDNDTFMSLPAGFGDFSRGISMFAVYDTDTMLTCVDAIDLSNGPEVDDITLGRHDGHAHYEVFNSDLPGDDFPLGTQMMVSVVHRPDLTVQLRVNSAPFAVGTFDLPASVTRLSNVVGRSEYADCGSLSGGLWEVFVYGRALDNDERAKVESYLQTRWDCCR